MLVDYRVQQREYLLDISRALTAELNLDDLLQMVLSAATKMLVGQAGLIALRSLDGNFVIGASYGLPKPLVPYFQPLLADIPTDVERTHFAIPGLAEKLGQIVARLGLRLQQVVALPMAIGRNLIGVLYIFRAYGSRFTADDRQILASFADQAAIAVHNAQLYERISREKHRLDAILEYTADGVLILDAAYRVVVFNRALVGLIGWPAAEALGQSHDDVIPWAHLQTEMDMASAVRGGWPLPSARPLYVEGDLRRYHGGTVSVGITYAPLFDVEGHLVNVIGNVRDITRFREADEIKSTFVSVVSHELKTPVALIKGYADTLMREDARWDPDVMRDSLSVILEEADRLNSLIDNLLDASRLQASALPLEMDEVALDALAERVASRFRTQTERHEIVVTIPYELPIVVGDEGRIEQVLNNLISNAIKYSPEGGRIEVSGRGTPTDVIITVSDQGVGIPLEEQTRVFERFFRGTRERHQRTSGAGLGLYLAKAIVEAHNGRIWVESDVGAGSAFSFSIPRKSSHR
ncbi:MAG: PAS domain S-box protein [Chloroflexi bacterium]|nr:PAS domain S-box protein [Chloroflexota bacterium]